MTPPDDRAIFDLNPDEQSLDACIEITRLLNKQIRDIDVQLGSRNRTDTSGKRLMIAEWDRWRQGAIRAKNHRIELLQRYKARVRTLRDDAERAKTTDHRAETSAGCQTN